MNWQSDVGHGPCKTALLAIEDSLHRLVGKVMPWGVGRNDFRSHRGSLRRQPSWKITVTPSGVPDWKFAATLCEYAIQAEAAVSGRAFQGREMTGFGSLTTASALEAGTSGSHT